jgi:hypothetical protein
MVLMFQCFNMFQKQCNMDKSIIYQSKKRSCPKFQIKKTLPLKHGQINATISQVSMFHMFLYIIVISFKHLQIVFGTQPRERKIMHIGRQDCTSPVSCRDMPDPGDRVREY